MRIPHLLWFISAAPQGTAAHSLGTTVLDKHDQEWMLLKNSYHDPLTEAGTGRKVQKKHPFVLDSGAIVAIALPTCPCLLQQMYHQDHQRTEH